MNLLKRIKRMLGIVPKRRALDITNVNYLQKMTALVDQIMQDYADNHVDFVLNGRNSQVKCTFEWFASVTNGGAEDRVIVLRHAMLSAINILLGNIQMERMDMSDPLPLFVMHQGKPIVQYLFYDKTGCRVEKYDEDVALAFSDSD